MEYEFKALQTKMEADKRASEGITSHDDMQRPEENRSARLFT